MYIAVHPIIARLLYYSTTTALIGAVQLIVVCCHWSRRRPVHMIEATAWPEQVQMNHLSNDIAKRYSDVAVNLQHLATEMTTIMYSDSTDQNVTVS